MRSNTPYEYLNSAGSVEEVYSPSNPPMPTVRNGIGSYVTSDMASDDARVVRKRAIILCSKATPDDTVDCVRITSLSSRDSYVNDMQSMIDAYQTVILDVVDNVMFITAIKHDGTVRYGLLQNNVKVQISAINISGIVASIE